jgi:hypothetical protein
MKRAFLLLAAVALVAASSVARPSAAQTCSLTCTQVQEECDQSCEESLCQARFICDTTDPCDSTCTCIKCRP